MRNNLFLQRKIDRNQKVFVAMSGGVDSSVVAGLMKEAGYNCIGVTMCFSISYPNSRKPSCCGREGVEDARRAAQILAIPHYVLDFAADINDFIIENFTQEYLNGRTPNPCVRCNQYLKFGSLYKKVMTLGAGFLATGHYARIHYNPESENYELTKAKDERKDQSYFLYSIHKETLSKVLFPLGDLTKEEVRVLARKYHLNTAEKPESQDICFVPDTGYKQFIRNRLGEDVFVPGPFKNHLGEIVGQHKGLAHYTIGQRDQLGLSLGYPAYVYKIEKETNTVYVGPCFCLYSEGLWASQFNPLSMDIPKVPLSVEVQIRYHAPIVKGILTCLDQTHIRVDFEDPVKSVTPGQSVVFYCGDVVLGGAIIDSPIRLRQEKFPIHSLS